MIFLWACSAPMEAPEDLNSLLSYVFLHTMNEEEAVLYAGLENMYTFAQDNEEELSTGFAVGNLVQEALDSTPAVFTEDPSLYGVAVQYSVPFSPADIAYCNTAVPGAEVYSANYLSYEREYLSDLNCFLEQTCSTLRFRSTILSQLPFNVEMLSRYINELRWIDFAGDRAFVQRAWMDGEAESTADWADMTANFYLGFTYTNPEGSKTFAASWAAIQLGDFSLPEDLAKGQAIDGLLQNGEDLEAWLSENEVPY